MGSALLASHWPPVQLEPEALNDHIRPARDNNALVILAIDDNDCDDDIVVQHAGHDVLSTSSRTTTIAMAAGILYGRSN